ncbi:putative F-box protein at5g55150 [Phtheirospermum japonicum]|uniref:Putative F-box protein at5g55150 n=1 Tax=Phtheirospermum japonicum TaxID=374723 RepID=A0A830BDQ0_9LAMI|nr:putative F-box protein at5g55150 [Phtheirospermum japonicum]
MSTKKARKMTNFYPTDGKRYLSCGGWILCVSNGSGDVCLAHPVWRARIELPGVNTFPDDDVDIAKMVLSGSPVRKIDDFVVMVIRGRNRQLGFSRPGDKSWTVMDSWAGWFCDIIYHNGKLYALDSSKRVVECDIHGPSPTRIRQVFSLPSSASDAAAVAVIGMYYLVESCGKFLIVIRHSMHRTTFLFEVFEFDVKDGSHKEIKQFDKWNKAMFLGLNSSVCIELSDWDVVNPNCIYFTDDSRQNVVIPVVSVYSLISMKPTKGLYVPPLGAAFHTPPTWVMPSF